MLDAAPDWFRLCVAGLAGFGASAGGAALAASVFRWSFDPAACALAAASLIAGLGVWFVSRPEDWREWINLAATEEGIYLPGRKRRAVFVPWTKVTDIGIETWYSRGKHSAAILTLDLPEETWARFSPFSSIEGRGAVRTYRVSALDSPPERLAYHFKAFRETARTRANP